jgi:hypothetical protein
MHGRMDDGWVSIPCNSVDEARWGRAILDAAGIEAAIPDEFTPALPLTADPNPETVRLLVRAADAERALELLEVGDISSRLE